MTKTSLLKLGIRQKVLIIVLMALVLSLGYFLNKKFRSMAATVTAGASCKYLISYGVSHNGAYPEYIGYHDGASSLQSIEALPNFPYNGVGIETWSYSHTNIMHLIMKGSGKIGYQTIHDEYKPLMDLGNVQGIHPAKLRHNFLMVHLQNAGGFYDPNNAADKATRDAQWANVADNFKNLTIVAKEINDSGFPIDGIFLDNEGPYDETSGFWYCGSSTYAPACNSSNLAIYQEQSRNRGKQIMQAITPYAYSGFHFMFMHSTDTSCTMDPNDRREGLPGAGDNNVEWANQLLGSFSIGLAEASLNTNVTVVDGGEESYGYLTQDYFTFSKDYRDKIMATQWDTRYNRYACRFIPSPYLGNQTEWSKLFQIAFAMYNRDPSSTPGQTPDTIGESMRLALLNTDRYVWFYLEGEITTINAPQGNQISDDWTIPIKTARDAVVNDPSCDPVPVPLNLSLNLQGRTDASTSTYTLKIYPTGSSTPVYENNALTASKDGKITLILPDTMAIGASYSFYLKPKYYLADIRNNQILANPMNITFGTFYGGDFNDDNIVNSLDFSMMNLKWLKPDAIVDINMDGIVNSLDFSILNTNWLKGT